MHKFIRSSPALTLLALLLLTLVGRAAAPVELVLSTKEIQPTTTFEVRFSEPVIQIGEVGTKAKISPAVIKPALAGSFRWLSVRSGIFTPSETIPLGMTYQLTILRDFKNLDGKTVGVGFREIVRTPPMKVTGEYFRSRSSSDNASATPVISILLNAPIDFKKAPAFCYFKDAAGTRVPADVKWAEKGTYFPIYRAEGRTLLTWDERAKDVNPDDGALQNHAIVSPGHPLPAGERWELRVEPGLPSTDNAITLGREHDVLIGTIKPFVVTEVRADNALKLGRRLTCSFSKSLSEELKKDDFERWIKVMPRPKDLAVVYSSGSELSLSGAFELDREYEVTIAPGVPAKEPFILESSVTRTVKFDEIPPRLYFEKFEGHQLSTGNREFKVFAVNTPRVQLTVKRFQPDTASIAATEYQKYFNSRRFYDPTESYGRLDPDAIPGRTVYSRIIEGPAGIDETAEITLDWDEILGPGATGAVLLTAESIDTGKRAKVGVQALVQVTDLAILWKRSRGEILVHAFSMDSGAAVAGASVLLLDEDGDPVLGGETDASGMALLPVDTAEAGVRSIVVSRGDDIHTEFMGTGSNEIGLYRYDVPFQNPQYSEKTRHAIMLFSDRPVYKPGETVHLKAILRTEENGTLRVSTASTAQLQVFDARGRSVLSKSIVVSKVGSFSEDINLPENKVGGYSANVSIEVDGVAVSETHYFTVQDYKPNAFEVTLDMPSDSVGAGELPVAVTGKYYMGKSLSTARLHWSFQARDAGFSPKGFEDFVFCSEGLPYSLERTDEALASNGEFNLETDGSATITPELKFNAQAPQPREATLLCEVTDLNQQTVSRQETFTAHSSDFYLGLSKPDQVVRAGEPIPLNVVAVNHHGEPRATPVESRVTVSRIEWQTNAVVVAGNARAYRTTPRLERVFEKTVSSRPLLKYGSQWLLADACKEAALTFIPEEPGNYLVELSARDDASRDVLTSTQLNVYGAGELAWDYRDRFRIDLIPDRETYAPGDSAVLLVKTPIAGRALVTVERDRVLRTFETTLEGNAPSVRVPLEKGDGPNVFVSVTVLRGAADDTHKIRRPTYRMGFCKIDVAQPESKLTVKILPVESVSSLVSMPRENRVQPREEVRVVAEIMNGTGQPARGAEVTLYAVDEGVLSLTGYHTPDPLAFFNADCLLTVATGFTLPALMSEDPAENGFSNKGYVIGDGGPAEMDMMRKDFKACAFWRSNLVADQEGRVSTTFTAPDSLTRYRLIAVAHQGGDRFGSNKSAFEVSKPIMLQPSLPRFARIGDELAMRAVVHNQTDKDGTAEIRLELDGRATPQNDGVKLIRTMPLPAHASFALDFPVTFKEPGTAIWKWTARFVNDGAAAFSDEVQSELEVRHAAPLRREIHFARVEEKSADLLARISPEFLEGTGIIRVSVSNSRMIELWEPAQRLLHYPYGCVEQTTSSLLPWLVFYDQRAVLPGIARTNGDFDEAIRQGVTRLFTMQTSSGGLGYWPGATEPMLWGSAYGGLGIVKAKRAGIDVPEDDLKRLLDWISAQLRTGDVDKFGGHYHGHGPSDRCLALYTLALAGRPEAAYHAQMFDQRELLSTENRALLALAIMESDGPREMALELLGGKDVAEDGNPFYAISRGKALELMAWGKLDPKSTEIDKLAADLFGSRTYGGWITTQGNAWSLLALSEYLREVESVNPVARGTICRGSEDRAFRFMGRGSTFETTFSFETGTAPAPMKLELADDATAFVEVNVEAWPQTSTQVRQDRGYSVSRTYERVTDAGTLTPLTDPKVGDRVLVTLQIEARRGARYVAVDDSLPANFEAVNPEFKSQVTGAESLTSDWVSDFFEIRDDRVVFFCDNLNSGRYMIRYLARVNAAGTAIAPPAKIEEMYHPDRFGSTDSTQLVSLPLP